MNIEIEKLTIEKALTHLNNGDFSSKELVGACLQKIKERDADIHAYLEVFDDAIFFAEEADRRRAAGEGGALCGIPFAIKDNILINGKIASASSKILENYRATYDAFVIKKLKEAGAVFLGRTNMDEFAMGSSTENSAFAATKNPFDLSRVPGGSSGGSIAAVASGMALGALGSETGGSVRQPAALCGIVGLKPTYGRVSRSGLMAMGSSLDQVGPAAKTVADAKIIFDAICGHDPMDSTNVNFVDRSNIKNKYKIGVPREFISSGMEGDALDNFNEILDKLASSGHEIIELTLPRMKYSLPVYYIIMPAEVSSNLARYDGMRYGLYKDGGGLLGDYLKSRQDGFGAETRRRIMLGTYVLSAGYYDAYYKKAVAVRELIKSDFRNAFKDVDIIALPTTTGPAFKIGEKSDDPLSMYLQDIFTVSANVAGIPAISVPAGFVARDGLSLPLGFQLMSPHFMEDRLFDLGTMIEGFSSRAT